MEVEIFAAALEYAPSTRVDGSKCTWIRMRVFVDGSNTWREYDRGKKESVETAVKRHLAANDIPVIGVKGNVARIDTKAIDLTEYGEYPGEGITVRTLLTVTSGDDDLFGEDSVWNNKLGSKTISEWYMDLASIV